MSTLSNTKILLGVTGGIAAYKCAELVRRLKDLHAEVQVVMTTGAEAFITPLTLQAVSGRPVRTSLLDPAAEAGMGHIELAKWADLVVIAPASADFLARVTHGLADDLLSTVCLATESPIALVPAMNQAMWHNPVTQKNVAALADFPHITLWGPASGSQACGDTGKGRMLEPADIVSSIVNHIAAHKGETSLLTSDVSHPAKNGALQNKTVVITAGPTREMIDPVRYLSNESSGKMGYALAVAAVAQGAKVHLISGPTQLASLEGVATTQVISAQEMAKASLELATLADVFIGAAAVADYRPATVAEQKMKKGDGDTLQINLVKNPDIIASVASLAERPAVVVGFAAETNDVTSYAKGKLERKGLDMIVANDVSDNSIGFNADHNAVTLFIKQHAIPNAEPLEQAIARAPKTTIASHIMEHIAQHLITLS